MDYYPRLHAAVIVFIVLLDQECPSYFFVRADRCQINNLFIFTVIFLKVNLVIFEFSWPRSRVR